jgi:uncharacterized protein YhbP (UPF0306 family)
MKEEEIALRARIAEYFADGRILHLATVVNGVPWLCHVWYATGPAEDSVVFTSNRARRHSKELLAQPLVAGGVVAIPLDGLGQRVRGISFEGRGHEAADDLILSAYEAYAARWPRVREMFTAKDIETGATQMRMYVIKLCRIVLFDEVNYPSNPRQELVLESDSRQRG